MMDTRFVRGALLLLILSGCASTVSDLKPPPDGLVWKPEAPFARESKVEVPNEAPGMFHFVKGSLLLGDGDFDAALKEFEIAAQDNPNDAFLHFRLATLYLRKGDLKRALTESETSVRLAPKNVDGHLLLAGLYSSLGENDKGLNEYNEVLKLDPKNQEALLYLGIQSNRSHLLAICPSKLALVGAAAIDGKLALWT